MKKMPRRSHSPIDAEPAANRAERLDDRQGGGPGTAVALMYHAVSDGAGSGRDAQYTLTRPGFDRQMHLVRTESGGACSARDWLQGVRNESVMLTFDDGKASDHEIVLPLLLKHGMTADFFVNPATVGRAGFVSWQALAEMTSEGMSVQSHGYDHEYLTHLDRAALRHNLYSSRLEIEDHLGVQVTLLAPPGGRMPPRLTEIARQLGYKHVMCSRPGLARRHPGSRALPRLAVTSGLAESTYRRWIAADFHAITTARVRYGTLAFAKWAMGDERYERLRLMALSGNID